jgi:multidrug efflux system membrane fusion protein
MSVSPTPRSRRRWYLYGAVFLGLASAVWYFAFGAGTPKNRPLQPAWAGTGYPQLVPVRTVVAQAQDLPVHLKAIGTVVPLNTVTVKSRVDGLLLRVAVEEGGQVELGQVLAEIDPVPYQIGLKRAEGQLQQTDARAKNARSDLTRFQEMQTRNVVSAQQLEAQEALVEEREGALAVDQSLVDDARLQLSYTRIVAPIAGRVGLRRLDAGNLVRQGDTAGLAVITQTHPITVQFTIPEVDLEQVIGPFRAGEALVVEAWDRAGKTVLATGVLKTVDNQIDIATGTLRLKAEFANDDERLFPNQFVNVRLRVRTLSQAVVIPAVAVQFGSRGTYVYVVDKTNKATIRDVVLGPTDEAQQAVSKGLIPGDVVVLEGLDRLREGSGVVLANDAAPASAPVPANAAP